MSYALYIVNDKKQINERVFSSDSSSECRAFVDRFFKAFKDYDSDNYLVLFNEEDEEINRYV